MKIRVERADDFEGFAAYLIGTCKNPIFLMNIYALLNMSVQEKLPTKEIKEIVITSLMHEFGHLLEEQLEKEFDEEFIQKVSEEWGIVDKTCKNCSYFVNGTRACNCPKFLYGYNVDPKNKDWIHIEDDEGWGCRVGDDFGCIHWKEKI